MFILPQDAVKLGEVQVQGPPASPTRGTEMTSALLMEEDGGEGDRKLCCCVLCCRLCYRRCCGVIVVSQNTHVAKFTIKLVHIHIIYRDPLTCTFLERHSVRHGSCNTTP